MSVNLPKGDLVEQNSKDGLWYGTREFMTCLKLLVAGTNQPTVLSGTTAQRPTRFVDIGTLYWDTTLAKLLIVSAINPIVWTLV